MKTAVVGSRGIYLSAFGDYLGEDCEEIVSGGARGVDECAARYALSRGIKLTEFLPEYSKYGRSAPIIRNKQIVDYADEVIAFWNGKSKGTLSVINYCKKTGKPCRVIISDADTKKGAL